MMNPTGDLTKQEVDFIPSSKEIMKLLTQDDTFLSQSSGAKRSSDGLPEKSQDAFVNHEIRNTANIIYNCSLNLSSIYKKMTEIMSEKDIDREKIDG